MIRYLFSIGLLLCMASDAYNQFTIRSGPMLGYATMREAAVWVQLSGATEVSMMYWDKENPQRKYLTATENTLREKAFAVTLVADSVEPGKTYAYYILVGGTTQSVDRTCEFKTQVLWQYRTDAPDFKVALGSCAFINEPAYDRPGNPYGGGYQVFQSIVDKKPDCMVWLGDNVYLREADYFARSSIFDRYTHTRSLPEMQALLTAVPHYAIWDDHDFGPDNANNSYFGKSYALEAFQAFWPATAYGVGGLAGNNSYFSWNDIDFFLLDGRWYRTPLYEDISQREILGQQQIDWLIASLKTSKSPYKMVCVGSQFLNTAETKENFANVKAEQQRILEAIQRENIRNVVFLTGDRHHSELSAYQVSGGPFTWDLTVSALTSSPNTKADKETNLYRVEGSLVMERNFAILEFTGNKDNRKLTLHIYDSNGKSLFRYEIPRS